MSAPHLRRRYRATGSRRGLVYLFLLVGLSALYVGQRYYTGRKQVELDRGRLQLDRKIELLDSLQACRDSLRTLARIEPRALQLGLERVDLAQLARLPLTSPVLPRNEYEQPAQPFQWAGAGRRIWDWLDGAGIETSSARAAP